MLGFSLQLSRARANVACAGSSRAESPIMVALRDPPDETERVALVTGGAIRIGRAIALALAAEGMSVVVHFRRSEAEAAGLCQELASRGVRAWSVQGDFT